MALLETLRIVAPFGLQLMSEALGRPVAKSIAVTISDPRSRYRPVTARANGSAIFVAHRLPGLSPPDLSVADWSGLLRTFRMEVTDASGDYLPLTARVTLPRRTPMTLADLAPASPPVASPTASPPAPGAGLLPLFASPRFAGAGGQAAIRVSLRHGDGSPAAWAVVFAELGGRRYRGVTDARGEGLVSFGWPQPPRPTFTSPPDFGEPRWPVSLVVHSARLDPEAPPDVAALLGQVTGPAFHLRFPASPSSPPAGPVLVFARTLTLPPATLVPA